MFKTHVKLLISFELFMLIRKICKYLIILELNITYLPLLLDIEANDVEAVKGR